MSLRKSVDIMRPFEQILFPHLKAIPFQAVIISIVKHSVV